MKDHLVVIKRINPRIHHGFRYEVVVYWHDEDGWGRSSWTLTKWGARREAKKLIKQHNYRLKNDYAKTVEKYRI